MTAWTQTYSGKKVTALNPDPSQIDIKDIGRHLSRICRFGGATRQFYSVAQHSVLVSIILEKDLLHPEYAMDGLLHDASEYVLGDVQSPYKHTEVYDIYRDCEDWLQNVICSKFGLVYPQPDVVRIADQIALVTEARDLMGPRHPEWVLPDLEPMAEWIVPLNDSEAYASFMSRFEELYANRKG